MTKSFPRTIHAGGLGERRRRERKHARCGRDRHRRGRDASTVTHSQTQSGSDQSKRSEGSSQRARLGGIMASAPCPACSRTAVTADVSSRHHSLQPRAAMRAPHWAATHGSSESTEARWRFVLSSHGVRGVCHGTPCLLLSPALSHTQYTESPDAAHASFSNRLELHFFFSRSHLKSASSRKLGVQRSWQLASPGKRARGTPTHRHRRRGRSPHEQGRRRRAQRAKRPGSRTASRRHGESLASPHRD